MLSPRLFYRAATYDPATELPIYVFDSSFLPSTLFGSILSNINSDEDEEEQRLNQAFLQELIQIMPEENHVIVLLTAGLTNSNSFSSANNANSNGSSSNEIINIPRKLIKLFKIIPQSKKSFLTKLYVVHGNWLIKSIMDISKTFWNLSSNLNGKRKTIIHCENLTKLSHHVDITKLNISLSNYLIDKVYYHNDKILLPKHLPKIYGTPLILSNNLALKQFSKIYNNILAFLKTPELETKLSADDWQMIIRASRAELTQEVDLSVDVLLDCLARDQLLYLPDWSFLEHYMIILHFITNLNEPSAYQQRPQPLFPISVFQSLREDFDFNDVQSLNSLLDTFLRYDYRISKDFATYNSPFTNLKIPNTYNNNYIIVKVLQLFKALQLKLNNEYHVIDPNAKNMKKLKERQNLRLILSFSKVLYNEPGNSDDDLAFDHLFRFVKGLMENWDSIKINEQFSLNDNEFNEPISFDNFTNFTNKLNDSNDFDVNDSPIVERTQLINPKLRRQAPPTPPIPREQQRRMASVSQQANKDKRPSRNSSLVMHSLSTVTSTSSSSSSNISEDDDDKENSPQSSSNSSISLTEKLKAVAISSSSSDSSPRIASVSQRRVLSVSSKSNLSDQPQTAYAKSKPTNELVKPSTLLTSKLNIFTERDLSLQAELERQQTFKGFNKTFKGRNVSKLVGKYEEEIFRDLHC